MTYVPELLQQRWTPGQAINALGLRALQGVLAVRTNLAGVVRLLLDLMVLAIAQVSDRLAAGTAAAVGLTEAVLSGRGRASQGEYRQVMRESSRKAALVRSARWCSIEYKELVDLHRMAGGRRLSVAHVGAAPPELETGAPFVLVFGHFTLAAIAALLRADYPGRALVIADSLSESSGWARQRSVLRSRLLIRVAARSRCQLELVSAGSPAEWRNLIRALREPFTVVLIAGDVWWKDGTGGARDFLAWKNATLPTAVARLSRMAGVPAVVCTPEVIGREAVRFSWGASIRGDHSPLRDREMQDALVDELERHIGLARDRYKLWLGWQRHWHEVSARWCDEAH